MRYFHSYGLVDSEELMGLDRVTLALFILVEDDQVLDALSVIDNINGVTVSVVAIGWI